MAASSRFDNRSELSAHSSLADEEIDLDKDRQRKLAEQNVLELKRASYTANVAAKRKRRQQKTEYSVAEGLKIAGGVAIAGAAWSVEGKKQKEKKSMFTTAVAAAAAAKAKQYNTHRDSSKTIAAALKTAGTLAVAGASWNPQKPSATAGTSKDSKGNFGLNTVAAMKAKRSKRKDPEKTIAAALRVAGGVAIAGASWTSLKPVSKAEPRKDNGLTFGGAVMAAKAINKVKTVRKAEKYTIANALKTAGGVAIAASSWTPLMRTMAGTAEAVRVMGKVEAAPASKQKLRNTP